MKKTDDIVDLFVVNKDMNIDDEGENETDATGNRGGGNPEDSTVETLFYSRHWFVSNIVDKISLD